MIDKLPIPGWAKRALIPVIVVPLVVLYPEYYTQLGTSQLIPTLSTAVVMTVFVTMAVGLNMVVGYAGLLDLGYVAFYAAGSYVAGWFASDQFANHHIVFGAVGVQGNAIGIHISIWILLVVAAFFAAMLGVMIGLPTLRLRGDYLALVTLGFGEIIPQVVRNGDQMFGTHFNLTNGVAGITPIDPMGFKGLHGVLPFLPDNFLLTANLDIWYYRVGLLLVAVTVFCSIRLRDSRLGRAWVAIREDEIAAAAMGVPLMRVKTWAYALGAFFGGAAGCFYGVYQGGAIPDNFKLYISTLVLAMVILGGMGNVWGVMLGAAVLAYLNQQGLGAIGNTINSNFGTSIEITKYESGLFGLLIVLMMLFRPQGLIPSARRKAEFEVVREQAETAGVAT
ncbi:MAG: branched-chain amino acid transport system permease protein [Gaiellales bacterium]|jgi:branched-chain amino acid transport system permease protein|nr:branched-chain amino acid transport system permease protein [Gaiellales bacterium]